MYRLIESICVENGRIPLWENHLARISEARNFLFQNPGVEDFVSFLQSFQIPAFGKWKLRIVYSRKMEEQSLTPYISRKIQSLKLIYTDHLEYSMKWEDRRLLESLFEKRGDADEIIIVKNGFITDTSFSNLAFFNGTTWLTPADPLLKGVQRAHLIKSGKLQEAEISVKDLSKFQKLSIINALNSLGDIELDMRFISE